MSDDLATALPIETTLKDRRPAASEAPTAEPDASVTSGNRSTT